MQYSAVWMEGLTTGAPFTEEELDAIQKYIESGGGLLLTGNAWIWPGYGTDRYIVNRTVDNYPFNQLARRFGVSSNADILKDQSQPLFGFPENFGKHPIMEGISQVSVKGALSTLSVTNNTDSTVLLRGGEDAYSANYATGSFPPMMVAIESGLGRTVIGAINNGTFDDRDGDQNSVPNIYEHSNLLLAINIFDWIAIREVPLAAKFLFVSANLEPRGNATLDYMRMLGIWFDEIQSNQFTEDIQKSYDVIIFDETVGSLDQPVAEHLDRWVYDGGILIDFSRGEVFPLFDISIRRGHEVGLEWYMPNEPLLTQPYLINPREMDSPYGGVSAFIELVNDKSFQVLAGVNDKPVLIKKHHGRGKVLFSTVRPYLLKFLANLVAWAGGEQTKILSASASHVSIEASANKFVVSQQELQTWADNLSVVYELMVDLVGAQPYDGLPIRYAIGGTAVAGLAGNPIRMAYLSKRSDGYDWGYLHEMGHDFTLSAGIPKTSQIIAFESRLYESFANVPLRYVYESLGIDG